MVIDNRSFQLVRYEERTEDVIDMGAPRMTAPRRRHHQPENSVDNVHVFANVKNDPLTAFEKGLNIDETFKTSVLRRPGRRHVSALYTPNPRLYPYAYLPNCSKSVQTPKSKWTEKKQPQQRPRGGESLSRNKRRKVKARRLVPNPRLYQAPPPRLCVPPPPLCPHDNWPPPPSTAPQETASQIALHLSERTIIPFKQYLQPALKTQKAKTRRKKKERENNLQLPVTRDKLWNLVAADSPRDTSPVRPIRPSLDSPPRPVRPSLDTPPRSIRPSLDTPPRSIRPSLDTPPPEVSSRRAKTRTNKPGPNSGFVPNKTRTLKKIRKSRNSRDKNSVEKEIENPLDVQETAIESFPALALPSTDNYVAPSSPPPPRYHPRSLHFRLRTLDSNSSTASPPPAAGATFKLSTAYPPQKLPDLAHPTMAASPHSSITPEDISDGNDSLSSAPSEYLAEFLSAIMSRKYAEALKYCKLILYYEPQNATARSFYPLLRHKLGQAMPKENKFLGGSNSEGSTSGAGANVREGDGVDLEEASDSDGESVASLSLDSSGKSSGSESPAARGGTDSASEGSAEVLGVTAADVTNTAARWLADDNGNPHPHSDKHNRHGDDDDDIENDNAAGGDHKLLLKDPQLRQLRAQFACSIK